MRLNTGNNNVHHHSRINSTRFQTANPLKVRQSANKSNGKHRGQYQYGRQDGDQDHHHTLRKSNQASSYRHPHQQRQHNKPNTLVLPQNRVVTKSYHTAERMKVPRLNGADLYVARLGRAGKVDHFDCGCERDHLTAPTGGKSNITKADGKSTELKIPSKPSTPTGSLHDELLFPLPRQESKPTKQPSSNNALLTATQSRPCYRCISYMRSAGIKRVFWTNSKGGWEGGKVRDLVDSLEGPVPQGGHSSMGAPGARSVYVTKFEVLLLKGLL